MTIFFKLHRYLLFGLFPSDFRGPGKAHFRNDLCRAFQHRGDPAILFFRQPDRIFHRLARNLPGNRIDKFYRSINRGRFRGSHGFSPDIYANKRFALLAQMLTTSVAVQAHSPISTISIGPAAVFRWRSESITMAWPLLALATNRSPSV